jgi:hypothetical protein
MYFHLKEHEELSGSKAKIYSVQDKGDEQTYLEHFIEENITKYPNEVGNILEKLSDMGHFTGCESNLFKHNEGKAGDGVVCLKDESKRFRLYCMYLGEKLIVCGSGGWKDPKIKAYQEDEILNQTAQAMKDVAAVINKFLQKGNMEIEKDGTITIYDEDYE